MYRIKYEGHKVYISDYNKVMELIVFVLRKYKEIEIKRYILQDITNSYYLSYRNQFQLQRYRVIFENEKQTCKFFLSELHKFFVNNKVKIKYVRC